MSRVRKPTEKQLALNEQMKQPTKKKQSPPEPEPVKPVESSPPPQKEKAPVKTRKSSFTLAKCVEVIRLLPNPDTSQDVWVNALTTLAVFAQPKPDELKHETQEEVRNILKDYDIGKLVRDYDKTVDIIDNKVRNRANGEEVSPHTIKPIYDVITKLIGNKKGQIDCVQGLRKKYIDKKIEWDEKGMETRRLNIAKGGNAKNPSFTWEQAEERLNRYVDTQPMGDTGEGKHRLRCAVIVGFYIFQRPRREQDYNCLRLYKKLPTNYPEGENILIMDKDKATMYIDKFKTRWITTKSGKSKEQMERYVKELNPKLVSLLKTYIKFFDIKDKDVLFFKGNPKDKKEVWDKAVKAKGILYNPENGKDKGFAYLAQRAFLEVLGVKDFTINSVRHIFNTFIDRHSNEYNLAQRRQISIDVGDTPRDGASNIGYVITNPENRDKDITEIQGEVLDKIRAREQADLEAEEEGSVGDINEVQQPTKHVELDRRIQDLASAGAVIDAFYTLMRPVLIDLINRHRE